eukprot:CAMPEP_0206257714 /NCGR_PEP_ID=MMETSP0047_2-20121206/25503_1 /ASSEMBLY_ACC=CAM_ASM_000192 /TAXON_ID=195065 /ORGANISM="Chroomonas mesostigmatica_cf, Strain CCMP1168" /LENGTH=324 /DNA_ID=CAMNT_0053684349 /DNA_START=46 /DNA_END=1017 /DNA_ORIENTATION=-
MPVLATSLVGARGLAILSWRKGLSGGCSWRTLCAPAAPSAASPAAGAPTKPAEKEERFEVIHKRNSFKRVASFACANQLASAPDTDGLPEICVAGRTNAGKSSLVNHLLGSNHMAKASSRQGKTTHIDLYEINDKFIFADMPGYGFGINGGILNHKWRREWKPLIYTYLQRETIKAAIFACDIRWVPTQEDVAISQALRDCGIPTLLVMTKDDRILNRAGFSPDMTDDQEEQNSNPDRQRPVASSSVAEARAWLAARVRARLNWPKEQPHLHYSIESVKGRKHLRRWLASFVKARDREEAWALLGSAWSRTAQEQALIERRIDA